MEDDRISSVEDARNEEACGRRGGVDAAANMIFDIFEEGYAGQEAIITEHAAKVRGCTLL